MIISSQRHLDEDIVTEKIEAEDFEVLVSPEFIIDGENFQVVLNGHHSLAAAKAAGVEPVIVEADGSDHDAICILEAGNADEFLMIVHMGDNYYDVETGNDVW